MWCTGSSNIPQEQLNWCASLLSLLQDGETLIQEFLEKAKSLPAATMSEEEVKTALRKMKQELLSKNNTYITEILSRCVPAKTVWFKNRDKQTC